MFLAFGLVSLWVPICRWCGICVLKQNGKYHRRVALEMTWYLGQGLLKSAPAFPKGLTSSYNADKDKMIPELIPPWPLPALPLCGVSLQQVEE